MNYLLSLQQAVTWSFKKREEKPPSDKLVLALVAAEKLSRQTKPSYTPQQLKGTWRLCFITGTKQVQNQAGVVLRSGRYLPRWANVELTYNPATSSEPETIENSIKLGAINLTLTGPAKFLSPKNILAFDFTQMSIALGNFNIYQGTIRGGQDSEKKFYEEKLKKQAFFTYFLIEDNLIAARGRGGGLALWGR
ncbi:hypothetical protein [Crocosphaera chwakensis]|uniref:Plastid lipid-associated protein/fibrillin conserved domain-containing protein n=1 Tax=Crocosphaera chwakensis CCY0110 TaxID=391612 RepID=A3IWF6_9CHRO|nr:hypothetical protein [Crocosphaera chwakensis]EAZ89207.1 hypothetical protein CY0110_15455 [Crocosphaera chwakensis CCY0110]